MTQPEKLDQIHKESLIPYINQELVEKYKCTQPEIVFLLVMTTYLELINDKVFIDTLTEEEKCAWERFLNTTIGKFLRNFSEAMFKKKTNDNPSQTTSTN